ncbi:MAG: J domain-containing protein [Microthrixaceae bacterium]
MNHYQVLGVEPDSDTAQIRQAYLRLARVNHPDFSSANGEQMRLINAAWHVLGDPGRRTDYDLTLHARGANSSSTTSRSTAARSSATRGADLSSSETAKSQSSRIFRPSSDFTPYSNYDDDDDDSWRYEPDAGDPATVPSKVLLAAPACAFAGGVALLAVSAPTGIREFTAMGLILLVLSALLFVGAPVVALFKSQIVEQQAGRRRSRRGSTDG